VIRRGWLVLVVVLLTACSGGDRVVVGAGTTTVDSGFMAALEDQYGSEVSIVAGSTAELLELAAQGSVDVVIVHDERQELNFMANHAGARRAAAFESQFLLVGPAELVDSITAGSAVDAMGAIAGAGYTFVTRDDGSGTHSRELALWAAAGVTPDGAWYIATGQGMGLTLQIADQLEAFTLVEAGVYASASDIIDLVPIPLEESGDLRNPYSVISVSEPAIDFFMWLAGESGARGVAAADAAVFAEPIYRTVTTTP